MSDSICSSTALFVTRRGVCDGISMKSGVGGGGGGMCRGFLKSLLCVIGHIHFVRQFHRGCAGCERVTCFVLLLEDLKVAWL